MDYFSIDTVVDSEKSVHFPTEFLNSQTPSGMPPHKITEGRGSNHVIEKFEFS